MRTPDRLRIAVQRSGRLAEPARDLLGRAGLVFREGRDRLFAHGESLPIDLLLVRDDDIPGLIAEGICDLGIVGRNVLEEHDCDRRSQGLPDAFRILESLGFGRCRLSVATPLDWSWAGPAQLQGLRIATSHPRLLSRWLHEQGVEAAPIVLSGSVEIAPRLGKAEAICDLVSTGSTLLANQLQEVAVVLDSEAVLAGPALPFADARAELAVLLQRRLSGALGVRASKLVLFQAQRTDLPALLMLLPDAERPTVMTIEGGDDQVALQALCRGAMTWQRLEEMKRAGASGLLVLPVEQMLA